MMFNCNWIVLYSVIGMHIKKSKTLFSLYMWIQLSILTYVRCTTGFYIQAYTPHHSVQTVYCKDSHSDSYHYSCGHSFYHRFHPHILHKKELRYSKLFYLCDLRLYDVKKTFFLQTLLFTIFTIDTNEKKNRKKYKLIYISKEYEVYLCHRDILSTKQHIPRHTDQSRGYRQRCLYSVRNIDVYSLYRTSHQHILYVRKVKL